VSGVRTALRPLLLAIPLVLVAGGPHDASNDPTVDGARPAGGTPADVHSDLPWLPIDGPWASVRLRDGVDPDSLGALLARGRPLRSAPIWRVPTEDLPALVAHPAVAQVWGLGAAPPPPDDIPPVTPDFDEPPTWRDQRRLRPLGWWPGGLGEGILVVDVEYDFDPSHEDLANNPPALLAGVGLRNYVGHGNACLGLVGASDDGYGITGGAPLASLAVVHPTPDEETWDPAWAIEQALEHLEPGDVLLIEQQYPTGKGLGPITSEPGAWEAVRAAVDAGIHVIEPAGNRGVDLDDPDFDGWFSRGNDSGSIMVGGVEDGAWNGQSGFGTRVDLHADTGGEHAPGWTQMSDAFFPDADPRQAYTARFGGTSSASAQVASLVAAVQGVAFELHGEPIGPAELRSWLVATGEPQEPTSAAEHPVGVGPDAQRAVRAWLAW